MARFLVTGKLNKLCLSTVLVAFSMTYTTPQVYSQQINFFNEAALMFRLEKLVEKLWKLEKKGSSNDMIDILVEIKHEIEVSGGVTIPVEQKMNEVYREVQKKGYKMPQKQWNNFKKKFKYKDNKSKNRAKYLELALIDPLYEINEQDELLISRSKQEKEDKEETKFELPLRVTFGVTIALTGLFLCCLPMPQCKTWGQNLIQAGVFMAMEGGISKTEKDEDDKKKK